MLLEVGGQNIELTDTLRLYVERRVHFALSRFAPRIKKVKIHIQETNRPRRELGKTCQITVILPIGTSLSQIPKTIFTSLSIVPHGALGKPLSENWSGGA